MCHLHPCSCVCAFLASAPPPCRMPRRCAFPLSLPPANSSWKLVVGFGGTQPSGYLLHSAQYQGPSLFCPQTRLSAQRLLLHLLRRCHVGRLTPASSMPISRRTCAQPQRSCLSCSWMPSGALRPSGRSLFLLRRRWSLRQQLRQQRYSLRELHTASSLPCSACARQTSLPPTQAPELRRMSAAFRLCN